MQHASGSTHNAAVSDVAGGAGGALDAPTEGAPGTLDELEAVLDPEGKAARAAAEAEAEAGAGALQERGVTLLGGLVDSSSKVAPPPAPLPVGRLHRTPRHGLPRVLPKSEPHRQICSCASHASRAVRHGEVGLCLKMHSRLTELHHAVIFRFDSACGVDG